MRGALEDADLHKQQSRVTQEQARSRIHGGKTITASEGTCHAHSEADGHCEDAKQQQVDWVLLAVDVQRAEHCIQKI